jgi:murein DD-endopeptidase MepM/ murein hydrolase activator NlpD
LLLITILAFFYASYQWNRSGLDKIVKLESDMKVRDTELAQLNREFEMLKGLEEKLRTMAGLEPREYQPVPAMGGGQGGPYTGSDADDYDGSLPDESAESSPLQLSSRALIKDSNDLKESLETVLEIFEREKARLSSIPSISPVACRNSWISSGFGYRNDPINGEKRFHEGCDLVAPLKTPIIAPADGIVSYAGWSDGLGKMIEIEHGYGYTTRYGHTLQLFVNRGDVVKRGEVIAYVGSSGRSTGPHLHYEVRYHGTLVNPFRYLVE